MAWGGEGRGGGGEVVDVLIAIDVPNVRALAARKERRICALGEDQRRLMSVNTAGDNFFRALHQRVTLLECVGFHGNSCAMIFADRQMVCCRARPSARILFAGASVKSANSKRAASLTTHSPKQVCN